MNRKHWIAASLVLIVGIAAGCSNSSSSSMPKASTTGTGTPKGGESKSNVGKGGVENPPPP
jgi:hypothetical protein